MAFAVLAQLLTMARWFFVKAVLPKLYPASDRFAAIIVLAANMAVVASTALLELTTVLDFPGKDQMLIFDQKQQLSSVLYPCCHH